MSIVLFAKETENGEFIELRQEKDSKCIMLVSVDRFGQTEKKLFYSMKAAKQAIKRIERKGK